MPDMTAQEDKLKKMSKEELFEEMASAESAAMSYSRAKIEKGLAAKAKFRYNAVAKEVLRRKLWLEYHGVEID